MPTAGSFRTKTQLVGASFDSGDLADNTSNAIVELTMRNLAHTLFPSISIVSSAGPYNSTLDSGILVVSYAGDITINLPAVASSTNKMIWIKKISDNTHTITIDANSSELIDGLLTMTVITQYQCAWLVCDGSAWYSI